MANIATYISNLGKSISYSAVDRVKQMSPVTGSMIETNNELFKEVYKGVKDYKGTYRRASSFIKSSKVYEAGDQIKKSIFEDIKTGNFYNKKRESEMQIKAMGSLGDMTDFDMSSLDNMGQDIDSSFGDWSGDDGDILISDTINDASRASSEAISKTMARSAEYIVESNRSGNKLLYSQNAQAYSMFNANLSAINENIANVLKFSTSTLQTHAENSKIYYETTTKILNDHTSLLQKIADLLDPKSQLNSKSNISNKKVTRYDDLVDINGGVDIKEYAKLIKKNINNSLGSIAGMNTMFGEDSNLLMAFAGSPLKMIPDMVVKLLIPKAIDESMKNFNKSLEGFFGSLLMKFNGMKSSDNIIFQKIGEILGINNSIGTIETNKYNKGPVPFDGKTRKAIIEIIPSYLRRIESALTGKPERVFDMESGKFTSRDLVKKKFEDETGNYIRSATSDMESYFKQMSKDLLISNKDEYDTFFKDMKKFFASVYNSDKLFNPNEVNNMDFMDYGLSSSKNLAAFKAMYKSSPRWMQQQINSNILNQRSKQRKYMDELNESGDSIYNILYDNSNDDFSKDKNKKSKNINPGIFNIKDIHDNLGHNIFYYMQNSLKALIGLLKVNKINTAVNAGTEVKTFSLDDIKLDKDLSNITESSDSNSIAREIIKHNKKIEDQLKKNPNAIDFSLSPEELENKIRSNADTKRYVTEIKNRDGKVSKSIDKYISNVFTDKDGNVKEIKGSFLDKMLAATSLSEKSAVLIESLNNLSKKPIKIISSLVEKADQRLYDMIYTTPIKDRSGNEVKGFMDAMILKLESTFGRFNLWLDENIFEPLKKKLGVNSAGEFAHKIVKNIFGAFGLDLDEIKKATSEYLFGTKGEDGRRRGGLLGNTIQSTKDQVKGAFGYAKQSMKDVYTPAYEAVKYWGMNSEDIASRKAKDARNAKRNEAKHQIADILQYGPPSLAGFNKINEIESTINNSLNAEIQEHANGTRYVKKTGLTAISEGEIIIPSEMNPFYTKKTNKMSQQMKEKAAKDGLISKIGSVIRGNVKQNAYGDQLVDEEYGTNEKLKIFSAMGKEAANGISSMHKALFGDPSKDREKFGNVINDVTKNISEYAPTAIGGSVVGAGVSLLTGAIGGPLLGAAVGAGVSLIKNSETVRSWLFGKEVVNDEGKTEYSGGLISKDISNNIKKYLPDMAKYGTAGAITAILPFVPGGPIAGLMVGAGIGFAKNSESIQRTLFGEDGILGIKDPKAFNDKLKNAIPRMGVGAIGGAATGLLVGGPFGVVGNAAIGAGLGLISTTDSFQTFMFGEADNNGDRTGGLLGELKIAIVDPLKDWGKGFKSKVVDFIREEMAKPFKRAIQPISKQIELSIKGMFKFVGNSINSMFEKTIGIPLNHFLRDHIINPFTKLFNGVFKVLTGPAKFIISSPFKAIGAVGDHYRKKQIKSGNATYMTAQERLDFRNEKGMFSDKFKDFDKMLASMDPEQLDEMFNTFNEVKNMNFNAAKTLKSSRKDFNKDISSVINNHSDEKKLSLLFQKGRYGEVGRLVRSLNYLSPEQKDKLNAIIEEKGGKYSTAKQIINNSADSKNKVYKALNKQYGFEDINDSNIQKYIDMFNKEKRARIKSEVIPSELTLDQKQNNEIIDVAKKILSEVKKRNDPEAVAETEQNVKGIINKKTKKKNFDIIFDSLGNPRKILEDDQGNKMPDINDTQTKMAITAQENRDETQRGIYRRLGWLENLKKLFGKKEIKNEEPFWKKILKYLSIGAGILAAIYNDIPQKIADFIQQLLFNETSNDYDTQRKNMKSLSAHGLINFLTRGKKFGNSKILNAIPGGKFVGKILDTPSNIMGRFVPKAKNGLSLYGKGINPAIIKKLERAGASSDTIESLIKNGKTASVMNKLLEEGVDSSLVDNLALHDGFGKIPNKKIINSKPSYAKGIKNSTSKFINNTNSKISKIKSIPIVSETSEIFGSMFDDIAEKGSSAFSRIGEAVDRFKWNTSAVVDVMSTKAHNSTPYKAVEKVGMKAGNIIGNAKNKVTDATGKAVKSTGEFISNAAKPYVSLAGDVVAPVGKAVDKLANNRMIGGVVKGISERLSALTVNPMIAKRLGANGMKALQGAVREIVGHLPKILAGSSKILAKAASGIMTAGGMTIFWVAAGFIDGWNDARRILGINTDPTLAEKATAGLVSGVNELAFGIIPESLLVNIFMKYMAPVFGLEDSELAKKREAAQQELDQVNAERAENGEEALTMDEYLNSKGYGGSMAVRVGKSIGKGIQDTGERFLNLLKGKGFHTNNEVDAGDATSSKEQLTALWGNIKSISIKGFNLVTKPFKDVIDIAFGKSDKDYWDVSSTEGGEEPGLFDSVKEMLTLSFRIPMYPIYLTLRGFHNIWEKIKDNPVVQKVREAGSYTMNLLKYNLAVALGKTDSDEWTEQNGELISSASISDDDPMAGVKRLIFYSVNTALFVPFLVIRVFNKLWKKINGDGDDNILSKIVEGGKYIFNTIANAGEYMIRDTAKVGGLLIKGDFTIATFKSFFSKTQTSVTKQTGIAGALETVHFYLTRILGAVPFTVGMLLRQAPKGIESLWNKLKDAANYVTEWKTNTVDKFANQKGWKGYWTKPKDSTGFKTILFYMGRVISMPFVAIQKFLNAIGVDKFVDNIKEKFKSLKHKVDPILKFLGLDKYWTEEKPGSKGNNGSTTKPSPKHKNTSDNIGKGSGFVSQLDPSIRDKKFGNSTIGDSGCAPATAAMMINHIGSGVGINQTAKDATKYQSSDGAVNASYFKNEFSKYGIDSKYTSSQKDMMNNLRNGQPMILLGSDPNNKSKSNSPYGSNGHYIMATGIDKNGNVIVNDPELKGQKAYRANTILSKTNLGISAKFGRGSGLFAGSGPSNANEPIVYKDIANRDLRYFTPLSDDELNAWINAKAPDGSPFRNRGSIFNEASRASGLDPRYIFAHASVESGYGKSHMGSKNNYFGIGAFDSSPYRSAKYMGSGLRAGIIEGAKWIAKNYTNNGQHTLFLMIHGKNGSHRYASAGNHWINQISTIMSSAPGISNKVYTSADNLVQFQEEEDNSFNGKLSSALNAISFENSINSEFVKFLTGDNSEDEYNFGFDINNFNNSSNSSGGPAANNANSWFLNLPGFKKISSRFGASEALRGGKPHRGIDFTAPSGTQIKSPVSGQVIENAYGKSYGNNLKIKDKSGGLHVFAHMKSKSPLSVGSNVTPGTLIGYVGSTGHSTGPHLHYETRNNSNTPVDPNSYLSSYTGGGTQKSPVIDISRYNDTQNGKGGSDNNAEFRELVLEVVKVLVKIVDNTDKLTEIVDLLKQYVTGDKSKSGKGSGNPESKLSSSNPKQQIMALIKQSDIDNIDYSNKVLLQQLNALAQE